MPAKKARRGARKAAARGGRGRRAARQSGGDERSDYRRKVQDQKLEAANKKGSCLPKLFVLLMPFLLVGTYFLIRS
jgi:hypothetical protein